MAYMQASQTAAMSYAINHGLISTKKKLPLDGPNFPLSCSNDEKTPCEMRSSNNLTVPSQEKIQVE